MHPSKYWHDKAAEARNLADAMTTDDAQNTLLRIAGEYDALAHISEQEEAREAREAKRSSASHPQTSLSRSS